ncbi:protein-disulfide reductase DsbD [Marinospirillum perlucidum]|uniref:protein-disulfide reductase DsbD n=1 Tax=Marinospirillum perlucidum TaxID=1982602 RepID=UPI000DF3A6C3|nr:protein-disulfide reductase DsbD [Marinospirillum perlucidum]
MNLIVTATKRSVFAFVCLLVLMFGSASISASSLFNSSQSSWNSWFSDSEASPQFLPPEEAFKQEAWIEGSQIFIRWDLEPGYYLYQKQFAVTLPEGPESLTVKALEFAPAVTQEDDYFGVSQVYYSTALMAATLEGSTDLQELAVKIRYQGCADEGLCYPPQYTTLNLDSSQLDTSTTPVKLDEVSPPTATTESPASQPPENLSSRLTSTLQSGDLWLILGLFFAAGLGLTFTPCVLPMLPILSAILVGKGDQPQNSGRLRGFLLSAAYVTGMALTYALLGALMGLFGAGLNLQAALQSPWVLVPFALLFLLLALAMFGIWELRLPAWLDQRLQALQQPKGGTLVNVALMGALSTLVVSPCMSAPLAGALAFIAVTEDALTGAWALLAMGLGMGLPLLLIATFGASWLPRAGAWMNQVKAFFGFLLLAVAIWLVERLLPAPMTLALWGLLALGGGIFLGGLQFQLQGGWQKLRLTLGLALIIYGASLLVGALAGSHNPWQPLAGLEGSNQAPASLEPIPLIDQIATLDTLINTSRQPVLVDLYADWCISCKVMENEVFPDPTVIEQMQGISRVKLDLTDITPEKRNWLNERQLFGPPSFLFYIEGQEARNWRIQGEMNAAEMARHLQAFQKNL